VALVGPEPDQRVLGDPFFASTIRGLNAALRDTDLQLILVMARPEDIATRTLRFLRGGHVDGAVVVSHLSFCQRPFGVCWWATAP
jgi:DNA-binding LacI/PurR family transcriptional regulator